MFKKGMTQVDIINKVKTLNEFDNVKISKTDLNHYLNGKTIPVQKQLCALAKALNVSEAWLLGYEVNDSRISDDSGNISPNEDKVFAYIRDDVTEEELEEITNFIESVKNNQIDSSK